MKLLKAAFSIAKNKYIISLVCFIVWMCFFDPKDWALISSRVDKLKELQKSEQHLDQLIAETRNEQNLLKTNAATIEKYARENYLMKKDNEDLFIVNEP
ncbi:MAG: septum formation initiator family protein [Ferruginibacter sp.]